MLKEIAPRKPTIDDPDSTTAQPDPSSNNSNSSADSGSGSANGGGAGSEENKDQPILQDKTEADPSLARIKENLIKFATKIENSKKKTGLLGALKGLFSKKKKKKKKSTTDEGGLMNYITDVWRSCVYPYFPVNQMVYCKKNYGLQSEKRTRSCQNLMCKICCDHLHPLIKYQAFNNILGSLFNLNSDAGYEEIKDLVPPAEIHRCRKVCNKIYPMVYPMVLPPPQADPELGKSKDNPAKSCVDILKYGKDAPSGNYWVAFPLTGSTKVYCDMENEGGGWTLFFNYVHHPFEDYQLDGNKLPETITDSRSHIKLDNLGVEPKDVRELRFFCSTQTASNSKKVIHFSTENDDVIKVAFTEDQRSLKFDSFSAGERELSLPNEAAFSQMTRGSIPAKSNAFVGDSPNGGFWNRPFGIEGKAYWSVKGEFQDKGIWECDDYFGDADESEDSSAKSTDIQGTAYETVHRVFFRGEPPSEDFARQRLLKKLNK